MLMGGDEGDEGSHRQKNEEKLDAWRIERERKRIEGSKATDDVAGRPTIACRSRARRVR